MKNNYLCLQFEGIGSVLGGGKFIDGFRQGVITAGLNHAAHLALKGLENARQKQSSTITLKFDGERIHVIENGKEIASYPAASGRPGKDGAFDYSIYRQQIKNVGPIPEGSYLIDSDNTQKWADLSFSQKTAAILNLGQFPGGTIAWGSERVDIIPLNTTNVYNRFGFTIHGGAIPGSAGCIDLTTYDKAFFSLIRNHGLIKLTVDY